MFHEKFGRNVRDNVWIIAMYFIAAIFLLAFVFPYLYMLFSSFKPSKDVISVDPTFFPKTWSMENYAKLFSTSGIPLNFTNSLIAALASTLICLVLGSLASYAISRAEAAKFSNLLLILVLSLKMIPTASIVTPIYSIVQSLGVYDMLPTLCIVYSGVNMPFVLWMMISFFKAVPQDLDEAAAVDGAGPFRSFFTIILPVVTPSLISTGIFTFLLSWNDFLIALLLTSSDAKTVPVALSEFLTSYSLDLGPMTAAAVCFSLPVIVISFILQRYLVSGMLAGAVKG